MAEFRIKRVEPAQTKLRNVPIAVTPEGFWCCPAPVVFQKTVKNPTPQNKSKSSPSLSPPLMSSKVTTTAPTAENIPPVVTRSRDPSPGVASERAPKPSSENQRRKISVGFGTMETSDLKIVLSGKEGFIVRMSVHKEILLEQSIFFAEKLSVDSQVSCVEIGDCKDVEIYVETVGLMYCREVKQRLIRQNVPRVLRILKLNYRGQQLYYKGSCFGWSYPVLGGSFVSAHLGYSDVRVASLGCSWAVWRPHLGDAAAVARICSGATVRAWFCIVVAAVSRL